jgi:hypothetical protein
MAYKTWMGDMPKYAVYDLGVRDGILGTLAMLSLGATTGFVITEFGPIIWNRTRAAIAELLDL